jgi:molecular chaperone GrpE
MSDNTHKHDHDMHTENVDSQASAQENQDMNAAENTDQKAKTESQHGSGASDPLTELQEKYDILNDKYLRLYSEFENFRRRTAKEKLDISRNAGSGILKEFLPVVDDFDRAIAANAHNEDLVNVKEGFDLIHHKFMKILEAHGVKPMNAQEKPFDTNYHEAITNIPAPTAELKGKVVDVAEKGYFFHDQVLRYAKVVVGQ